MIYTNHAETRMKQRGIDEKLVMLVDIFGQRTHEKHASEMAFLNKKGRQRIRAYLGKAEYACIEKKLNAYFVEASGRIITVGHRYKNIKTH